MADSDEPKQAGGAPRGRIPQGTYPIPFGARVPTRTLGRTGERVSILGLGGYHLGLVPDEGESLRMVHRALEHGLTFLDNCWDYNDGRSEERMGKALRGRWRSQAFLMTKLDARTGPALEVQLEQSLKRLQTDVIDLVQLHEVIRMDDAERAFARGGAMEALVRARKSGKLRYLGFTGHKDPRIHLHMLEVARANGFHFDAVQMPLNVLDAHYRSFQHEVLPVLRQEGIGVLGMKPLAGGLILQSGAARAEECLRYAMSIPGVSVTITGCDSEGVLEQALALATDFRPMDERERSNLLARTVPAAARGQWEKFKSTTEFDGTTQVPRWLTTAQL